MKFKPIWIILGAVFLTLGITALIREKISPESGHERINQEESTSDNLTHPNENTGNKDFSISTRNTSREIRTITSRTNKPKPISILKNQSRNADETESEESSPEPYHSDYMFTSGATESADHQNTGNELSDEALQNELVTILQTVNPHERRRLLNDLAKTLATNQQLTEALGVLDLLTDFWDKFALGTSLIKTLADNDPAQAQEWIKQLPDDELKLRFYDQLGKQWAERNPGEAAAWVMTLENNAYRMRAIEGLAYTWATKNLSAAYEWSVQVLEANERDSALTKIAKSLTWGNPELAARWAAEFPEGGARLESLRFALFHWLPKDPQAVVSWVEALPPGDSREKSLQNAAQRWATFDPQAAADWANRISEPASRNQTIISVLNSWSQKDPAAAARWVDRMTDPELKQQALKMVAQTWMQSDPSAAERWLRN
jgi:hypothetical protein